MTKKVKPVTVARPILKWAGGKRQLLGELKNRIPDMIPQCRESAPGGLKVYYEPFVGGGALFFGTDFKNSVIGDANEELINVYRVVRDDVKELIEELKKHPNGEDYFYKIRSLDICLLSPIEQAGRFIYLNKTCFNGLCRVNRKGHFNAPFGSYKNPNICDEPNLMLASARLSDTQLVSGPFQDTVKTARKGDFVYFDPPYDPISVTSNFTAFTKGGFGKEDQLLLSETFRDLDARGVRCMLSNSFTDYIKDLYAGYNFYEVEAARAISSRPEGRGKIREFIITNYEE